jgi:hypothetical protein
MITLGIHDPVFASSRTAKNVNESIYCVVEVLSYPDTFTLFLSSADDARELSKQFDAIADILSGVTQ